MAQNYAEAMRLCRLAATQGYAATQYNLGLSSDRSCALGLCHPPLAPGPGCEGRGVRWTRVSNPSYFRSKKKGGPRLFSTSHLVFFKPGEGLETLDATPISAIREAARRQRETSSNSTARGRRSLQTWCLAVGPHQDTVPWSARPSGPLPMDSVACLCRKQRPQQGDNYEPRTVQHCGAARRFCCRDRGHNERGRRMARVFTV
jgi:hypothetical protein